MRALGHLEACLGDTVLDVHLRDYPGVAAGLERAAAALPAALAEVQQAGRGAAALLTVAEYLRTAEHDSALERWVRVRALVELAHLAVCRLMDEDEEAWQLDRLGAVWGYGAEDR